MRAFLLLALLVPAPAPPQSLGIISGTVLSALHKVPLAASKVTLSTADGSPLRTVTADRRGRFIFDALPAGAYKVSAGRANYATGRYGQRAWNEVGRPITLAPGAAFTVEILLHRLGVITGTVVDENGEGMPDFRVRAITAASYGVTGRVSSEGVTDDRGVFRIVGLKPGFYYVATGAQQLEEGYGLLPTFYPQHLSLTAAQVVQVDIDRETSNVQIQPLPGRLLRLAGRVNNPWGRAGPLVRLTLFRDEESRDAQADVAGNFSFSGLTPGRYTLVGQVQLSPGNKLAGYQPVEIDRDIEGVGLSLSAAPDVRVRVVDEKDADLNDPQVVIFLSRIENFARTPPLRVERQRFTGMLAALGLMPGEWRFYAICPESLVMDSVTVDGKDALGGFALMPGQRATAAIRLAPRAGLARGRVLDSGQPAPGVSVLCYPLDPANRYRLGGYRSQKAGLNGEYRFGGLPEGEYLIFATIIEDFNPELRLEQLRGRVSSVRVTASAEVVRDLALLE